MPVIEVYPERLSRFLGIDVGLKQLVDDLPWLATDIEETGEGFVKIEFNPNRPDFGSHMGIARAYAGFLEIKLGYLEVNVSEPSIEFHFDEELKNIRGVLCSAVVRNIKLTEDDLKELIGIQEVLHQGIGRNRRKVSIGIHDLDKITPPVYYLAADPEKVSFKPLNMDRKMTLSEVLTEVDKGVEYGNIIKGFDKYPVITDSTGEVLSFPPIINSELTRLTPETRNLFIDVTALDEYYASRALNILLYAFKDMGGSIEAVKILCKDSVKQYPDLKPREIRVEAEYINSLLGESLSNTEIYRSLLKCRFSVEMEDEAGVFKVNVPPYRVDVMHKVDLVEEVAIGYGLWRLTPTYPKAVTVGSKHPETLMQDRARLIMIGLGYMEVFNFVITSENQNYLMIKRPVVERARLANSSSVELTMLRDSLLPGLIMNLSSNKHERYPQRIFETGPVVKVGDGTVSTSVSLAGVSAHSEASFSEAKATVLSLLSNLGVESVSFEKGDDPLFLAGRVANIMYEGKLFGVLGEVNPEVLELNGLENPVAGFELELNPFIEKYFKS